MKKKKLWITLTAVFGSLTAVFTAVLILASTVFAPILHSFLGTSFWEMKEGEEKEEHRFKSDYESVQALSEHEKELCEKIEAEGAVLLKNERNALPLASGSSVSCFSHSSVDIIYGGTGSGSMTIDNVITLKDSLEKASLKVNESLWNFYAKGAGSGEKYTRVNPATTGGYTGEYKLNEVPWSVIGSESGLVDSFASHGDAAIVVLSRSGGEGADLPYANGATGCKVGCSDATNGDYLALSPAEKEMFTNLEQLKKDGVFKKIVVLLNYSNAMQLDFLDSYGIDAALWIGDPGQTGINAVGSILTGKVNPSGRLVDTFLMDNHSSPAMANFGVFEYSNTAELGLETAQNNTDAGVSKANSRYVVYQEGIYIGYRYYETRYEDYVLGQGNAGEYDYASDVAYPFGYGLSYSTFAYSDFTGKEKENGDFEFTVKVTNEGKEKAKHTVQLYFQSEYTDYDRENGIEKAAVELCGFEKKEIAGGASEIYTITVPGEQLRTYDANGAGTYIRDAGTYYFTVGTDAHDAVNNILARKGADESRMTGTGDGEMVWSTRLEMDREIFSKSERTGEEIVNRFDNADLNRYEGANHPVTYLTRSDWTGTFPTTVTNFAVTDAMWKDGLAPDNTPERAALIEKYAKEYWGDATMPVLNAKNGLKLVNFLGAEYDGVYADEEGKEHTWNDLLSQLSYEEMVSVIGNAFHFTNAAESIALPRTLDENGPQGYTKSLTGGMSGMCYTSEDVMAATFNLDLIADMGDCIGEDCLDANNAGLYGPGANVHRTPYSGRNFEYYSEDPFISGIVCETEVRAIQSNGVYVFTKHFALNDQENGRYGISTWANEQTIREIYLEGFEGSVKGGGSGVMSSFNRIGVVWSGAHRGLMTEVLRNEWGAKGMAITDCSMFANYMDYRLGLLAGQNIWDGYTMKLEHQINNNQSNAAIVSAMVDSMHRISYSIVNSLAMNGISASSEMVRIIPWWQGILIGVCVVFFVATVGSATMLVIARKNER